MTSDALPPPGLPYHRLARTPAHRWWTPLAGLPVIAALLAAFMVALAFAFRAAAAVLAVPMDFETLEFGDPAWSSTFWFATTAAIVPAVLLTVRWTRGRPTGAVSSVVGRLRWGLLLRCALAALPAVAIVIGGVVGVETLRGDRTVSEVVEGDWVGWGTFLAGAAVVVLLVPFQAAAEEYLIRGWLLQAFGAWWRPAWPGVLLTAGLFALAHGLSEFSGFVALTWFGVVFGWLAVRTGGLEAGIAYHTVNNLGSLLLVSAYGGLGSLGEETAADAGWSLFAIEALVLPLYAGAALWLHRRGGHTRLSPGDEPAAPGPGPVAAQATSEPGGRRGEPGPPPAAEVRRT